jgi:ribosomal protein L37E
VSNKPHDTALEPPTQCGTELAGEATVMPTTTPPGYDHALLTATDTALRSGEVTPRATEVIELETMTHWWCRRCGRWEVCDDADLCNECGYMVVGRRGCRPRRPRGGGRDVPPRRTGA